MNPLCLFFGQIGSHENTNELQPKVATPPISNMTLIPPTETQEPIQEETDDAIRVSKPIRKKRGRPPLTEEQKARRHKPLGKWVPEGPGRPPLGEGESRAVKQVDYISSEHFLHFFECHYLR